MARKAAKKVLLIGWDGADWKVINALIEKGEMPVLARFLEEGVMADIMTLEPSLSPMLWTSIATGKRADKHGIMGFTEVDPRTGGVRPVFSTSRKVKAVWNILSQKGYKTHVVNWFCGHPAEPVNGICVSDAYVRQIPGLEQSWPVTPGTFHPPEITRELAEIRLRPDEISAGLIQLFVPKAAEVDQEKDKRLASVARLQAECYSVHGAATAVMRKAPWDFMGVYYGSLDHFSHGFMKYHPPRREGCPEKVYEIYKDVVSSGYRFHDLILRALLELAGEDTTVIILSDHGFHSDHLRPKAIPRTPTGPAVEHRPLGIFCMKGPGIKKDERIYGVSLLDITPTILHLFGLPAGQDMDGRVLLEAFDDPSAVATIPSWEKETGPHPDGRHSGDVQVSEKEAEALLEQFIALGYIEKLSADKQKAVQTTLREQKWNAARVYLDSARYAEALPLLEEIHDELPERGDYAQAMAGCQLRLGLSGEARKTVDAMIANHRETPAASLILGHAAFQERDFESALKHLLDAEKTKAASPSLFIQMGRTYLRLRRQRDAGRAFQRALDIDEHNAAAHQGMARALLNQRRYEEAAGAALQAVGRQFHLPRAHFYLGIALARLGIYERAIEAFETTMSFEHPIRAAHRWLARIHARMEGREDKVAYHRQQLLQGRKLFREERRKQLEIRRQARERERARAEKKARTPPEKAEPEEKKKLECDKGKPPRKGRESPPALDFIIVSGLPRSGTSLMMQMLAAGGLPVMSDDKRRADEDNPRGYYEWEPVKKLREHPELLREAGGKAVKVISMLLPFLPRRHRYKIIFMDRPVQEVQASQQKMLARRGQAPRGEGGSGKMTAMLSKHRGQILRHLKNIPSVQVLVVDYPGLVKAPGEWIPRVLEFIGAGKDLSAEAMAGAVQPGLHRNRA